VPEPKLPRFPSGLRPPEQFSGKLDNLEDYADLDDILFAADADGVVDVPAEDADSSIEGRSNLVREPVIVDRLRMLGYLPRASFRLFRENPVARSRLIEAVRRFQVDAGLEEDGWAGDKTWRALQELVTFETPTRVRQYALASGPRAALVRALRLRLWALGLLSRKPGAGVEHQRLPMKALVRTFWPMMQRLGIVAIDAPFPAVTEAIEVVFDQDRLLRGTARSSKAFGRGSRRRLRFVYETRPEEDTETVREQVRSFIVCLTKIELWLLGFEVKINGIADYRVWKFGPQRDVGRNTGVAGALKDFWERLTKQVRLSRGSFVGTITPDLLGELAYPPAAGSLASRRAVHGDYSVEVSERLTEQGEIESAWRTGKSLGARLWDGLKRVWRWLRRGARRILDVGRNLVRAFYRYAMKAFEIARFASRTVSAAASQYLEGRIGTGENNPVQVLLRRDGDLSSVLPDHATDDQRDAAFRRVRYFSKAFYFSAQLLVVLMSTVKGLIKGILASAIGWAKLLWMLVRSYRELRPLYRELRNFNGVGPRHGIDH